MFITKEVKPAQDPRHSICGLCTNIDILTHRDEVLNREVCYPCACYLMDAEETWTESHRYDAIIK